MRYLVLRTVYNGTFVLEGSTYPLVVGYLLKDLLTANSKVYSLTEAYDLVSRYGAVNATAESRKLYYNNLPFHANYLIGRGLNLRDPAFLCEVSKVISDSNYPMTSDFENYLSLSS